MGPVFRGFISAFRLWFMENIWVWRGSFSGTDRKRISVKGSGIYPVLSGCAVELQSFKRFEGNERKDILDCDFALCGCILWFLQHYSSCPVSVVVCSCSLRNVGCYGWASGRKKNIFLGTFRPLAWIIFSSCIKFFLSDTGCFSDIQRKEGEERRAENLPGNCLCHSGFGYYSSGLIQCR